MGRGREGCVYESDRLKHAMGSRTTFCYMYGTCCRPGTLKYSTNEKALAGTYTSILLGIQGSYFEPHKGTLYVTCTTHATHIQINTGQRGGSTELAVKI